MVQLQLIEKDVTATTRVARQCQVQFAGGEEYEVRDNYGVRHLVHFGTMQCVCKQWEISGIPCKHALAAITHGRKNVEDFVHPYFSKQMYITAHGGMIHPILDHTMWTTTSGDPLDPPPLRRLPGRPRKNRRREADEPPLGVSQSKRSQSLKFNLCKEFGHNKRTCQRAPVKGKGKGVASGSGGGRGRGTGRGSGVPRGKSKNSGRRNGKALANDSG